MVFKIIPVKTNTILIISSLKILPNSLVPGLGEIPVKNLLDQKSLAGRLEQN